MLASKREAVRTRFVRGFGATVLGPVVTIIVQVISVPVLLHGWGPRLYGEWLILSAIPTYIGFSDVGFGNVAANDMTMRVAAGDRMGALETFQSMWVFASISSLLVWCCFLVAIYLLPITQYLRLSFLTVTQTHVILTLLCTYALLSLQNDLMMAAFRCQGRYALGMLIKNVVRLIECLVMTLIVAFKAKPVAVAVVYLAIRTAGTLAMSGMTVWLGSWLRYGWSHATFGCMRRLALPAIAFMAFPAGSALSVQGMVLVVGMVLGPIAVATFSTMRTLTRFGFQIMEAVKNSVWPELSMAYGARNWSLARRLHRVACQMSLWSSLGTAILLLFVGDRIVDVWTHGGIVMDVGTFRWLLLVIVVNSFWYTSSVVTMASNSHERVAALYLAGSASSLILARLLIPHFGLSGAAMALLVIDVVVGWYALSRSLTTLSERAKDFYTSMLRIPEFGFRR